MQSLLIAYFYTFPTLFLFPSSFSKLISHVAEQVFFCVLINFLPFLSGFLLSIHFSFQTFSTLRPNALSLSHLNPYFFRDSQQKFQFLFLFSIIFSLRFLIIIFSLHLFIIIFSLHIFSIIFSLHLFIIIFSLRFFSIIFSLHLFIIIFSLRLFIVIFSLRITFFHFLSIPLRF